MMQIIVEATGRWQNSEKQQEGQQIDLCVRGRDRRLATIAIGSRIYILYKNEHDVVILDQDYRFMDVDFCVPIERRCVDNVAGGTVLRMPSWPHVSF